MPWVWVRRILASAWSCPPWEVDEAPAAEVHLELKLRQLEAEYGNHERQ